MSTKLSSIYLSMVDLPQDQVMLQLSEHVTHSFTCSDNCNRTWSCGRSTILKYTDDNLVLTPLHILTTVTGSVTVVRTCKGVSTKLSSIYLSMVDLPQDQVMLQLSEHVKE
jgi:hypothetical protein